MPDVFLLVDGYNIIGAWPKLIRLKNQGDLDRARRKLIETLVDFSSFRDWRTTVVFDAQYQATPSAQEQVSPHVDILFTEYLQTADTYIESRSYQLLKEGYPSVYVATSDRTQQHVVYGQGARLYSAERLLAEVRQSKQEQKIQQHKSSKKVGHKLIDHLDEKTRETLLRKFIYKK
jgi:uncharacterized protein